MSIRPRTKFKLQKRKASFERTEFGHWFLDDIRGEDITRDSHLPVCLLRHHDRRHSQEARATYWDVKLPVCERGEVFKIQELTEKKIHVGGLVALLLPQKLQRKNLWKVNCKNSLKIWAKSRILNSFVRNARKIFGRQSLSHHYAPVYAGRMRYKSCQRKWRSVRKRQLTHRKDQK